MSEKVQKVELKDIVTSQLGTGETAVIFQRHGKYSRNRDADDAGSLSTESAEQMRAYDKEFFDDLLKQEDVYVMFTSSDTHYVGKGHRSLETAQVAQDAAVESMLEAGLEPGKRIINLNPDYVVARHEDTNQDIRPIAGVREPQIFNPDDSPYLKFLQEKHGYGDEESKTGLSPAAWAMHEMDAESDARLRTNAEGQEDLIARTDKSLAILERYGRVWHVNNPGKRLVIWTASHYDTISPLVKRADGTLRNDDGSLSDAYQPVDYGGGIVINIPANPEDEKTLERRDGNRIAIDFGKVATKNSVTGLNQPKF